MFTRTDQRGNAYQFSAGTHTFAGFEEAVNTTVAPDEFSTVARYPLDRSEGVSFGRGNSENPDRAEAYKYLEVLDADGNLIEGDYKIVIENASGERVATIDRGRTNEVDAGDPANEKRGEYGKPFKYRAISGGKGEVLGGQGHRVALRLRTDDGTSDFALADSTMRMEGFQGELVN